MSKFDTFGAYLSKQNTATMTLSFSEIEKIIGAKLCKSAYTYDAYWQPSGHHSIANVISDCGYKTEKIDIVNQVITLKKQ